jgi:hypothetical protein
MSQTTAAAAPVKGGPRTRRRANHPAHERALVGLWIAQDALEEDPTPCTCGERDRDRHCRACSNATILYDATGTLFNVELLASCLEGETMPFPESLDRLQRQLTRSEQYGDLETILAGLGAMADELRREREQEGGAVPADTPLSVPADEPPRVPA